MLVGFDFEFIVENMFQNFSHILPVGGDAVFDGVAELKFSFVKLGFLSDFNIFRVISLSPYYGGDGSWHFVS